MAGFQHSVSKEIRYQVTRIGYPSIGPRRYAHVWKPGREYLDVWGEMVGVGWQVGTIACIGSGDGRAMMALGCMPGAAIWLRRGGREESE